jgi:hypothetical protein
MTRRNVASPSGRYSSAESPRGFHSYDFDEFDAISFCENASAISSVYGNASAISSVNGNSSAFGSVVGHDDPTAIMGNVRRNDSIVLHMSPTMDSTITPVTNDARNPDNVDRASKGRSQTPAFDEDEELRDKLSELDRTEEQWKRDTLGEASDEGYQEDRADRPTTPPSQRSTRNGTRNFSGRSGRSSISASTNDSIISMEEASSHTHAKESPANHHETDEIVRQVQRRLTDSHGLAAKTEISTDDSSDGEEKRATGTRKWRIILIVILLLVLGTIAGILYFWKIKDNALPEKNAVVDDPNDGGNNRPIDEPIGEPIDDPIDEPIDDPINDQIDGPIPTQGPSKPERLGDRFSPLSGDLVYDPTTPQFEAIEWLHNNDPARLNFDTISSQTLNERYIAALLHFAMNGINWDKSYGFLGQASVCEWKDEENGNGKGILCSEDGTIESIIISKCYQNACVIIPPTFSRC